MGKQIKEKLFKSTAHCSVVENGMVRYYSSGREVVKVALMGEVVEKF